jgi:hypothetical protein
MGESRRGRANADVDPDRRATSVADAALPARCDACGFAIETDRNASEDCDLTCGSTRLAGFSHCLTPTHAPRWEYPHSAVGHGHLYRGRFKSFPIQDDRHLQTVPCDVERNPGRAKLIA